MVVEFITLALIGVALVAEGLHALRIRRLGRLAFGPDANPRVWTWTAPLFRVAALGAMCWGFLSLWLVVEARVHNQGKIEEKDYKHLLLVMDVSPSMNLKDAGAEMKETRRKRASQVLESLFNRVPMREYKVTLVGVFSDAKPLLQESTDIEVVRKIIEELPLAHAFKPEKTKLLDGIGLAAKMAREWNPQSATMIVVTDGDTVPATGMPDLPASIANVLIVGVGDAVSGQYIDGHQSRQDVATLRQVANRLHGIYHNGNQNHLTSQVISRLTRNNRPSEPAKWTRREWALAAIAFGAGVYSALPILLCYFGSRWQVGVPTKNAPQAALS
jgi:Ca-activated chloride channel family protein